MRLSSLRCNKHFSPQATLRFISPEYGSYRKQIIELGSYAITELHASFKNHNNKEKDVKDFIISLSKNSSYYPNLRSINIEAPFAVIDGDIITSIIQLDAPFNELEMSMWSFHTPSDHMWKNEKKKMKKLAFTLNDGVFFSDSANNLLTNLSKHQDDLEALYIVNKTPHPLKVNRKLLPPRVYTYTKGIKTI